MRKEVISGVGDRSSTDKNTFKDLSHLCTVAEQTCSTFLNIKVKAKPCWISYPLFKKIFLSVIMDMCACVSVCTNVHMTVGMFVKPRSEPLLLFFINSLLVFNEG